MATEGTIGIGGFIEKNAVLFPAEVEKARNIQSSLLGGWESMLYRQPKQQYTEFNTKCGQSKTSTQ
nr:hypothetical protein Itr_chr09CG20550 [Ipomoea trifida]